VPTVGSVAGITPVIWPFDHNPPHIHAYRGTPNSPAARMSRFEIATGNVIDKPSPAALPVGKARQVQQCEHRSELQVRWQTATVIPDRAPPIAAIALRPEHVVRVFFADGEVRDVDLTPTLGTAFAALRDPETFANAHIGPVTGGLEWTDEIGLDPDVLYATLDLGPHAPRIRALAVAS